MAENKIELKSVKELLGMKFFIPSYQRGYRWTEQQVKDLLNDVKEYIDNQNAGFYSLQPLVVKKRWRDNALEEIKGKSSIEEIESYLDNCEWEVIDGQQRLTTIYIILSYLKTEKQYTIDYQTRKGFRDFLDCIEARTLSEETISKEFNDIIISNKDKDFDNIDFFHILTTYSTIKKWFEKISDGDRKVFKEQLLNNVKFIWYESVEKDPIRVFTRLNIGKIKLTNSELIKALMLNRTNFKDNVSRHIQLRQQEIASEWDKIEYTLQNDEFWMFLNEKGYRKPTRIDFIFDLICNDKNNGLLVFQTEEEKTKVIGDDDYRTFRYFYEYFHRSEKTNQNMAESLDKSNVKETPIEKCWNVVKKYFQTFQEWYNDLEMYHYVGFLVETGEKLGDILKLWHGEKTEFVAKLKNDKIRNAIKKHADLEEIYEIKYADKDGKEKTGVDKRSCKPILLLHNIQTVINQTNINQEKYQQSVFYKFPFHLYKTEGWDVEHIDSNTENDLTEKGAKDELLLNLYYAVDEKIQEKIKEFIANPNATNFHDFDGFCNNPNALSDIEKNQIWNYTLLDSSTNRSYGNSIFSAKRRIIIGKDRGLLLPIPKIIQKNGKSELSLEKMKKAGSAFIPPCTMQVFLKYYSPVSSNFNYWTKSDALEYKRNLFDTLKEFGVTAVL